MTRLAVPSNHLVIQTSVTPLSHLDCHRFLILIVPHSINSPIRASTVRRRLLRGPANARRAPAIATNGNASSSLFGYAAPSLLRTQNWLAVQRQKKSVCVHTT